MTKQKRYQIKHKEKGLCVFCTEQAIHGCRCRYHYVTHLIQSKQDKQKYRETGRCPDCGGLRNSDCDDGYITCMNCRQRLKTPKGKEYSYPTHKKDITF